jgi:hypothetical protein
MDGTIGINQYLPVYIFAVLKQRIILRSAKWFSWMEAVMQMLPTSKSEVTI